jgi:hypothetical protein
VGGVKAATAATEQLFLLITMILACATAAAANQLIDCHNSKLAILVEHSSFRCWTASKRDGLIKDDHNWVDGEQKFRARANC